MTSASAAVKLYAVVQTDPETAPRILSVSATPEEAARALRERQRAFALESLGFTEKKLQEFLESTKTTFTVVPQKLVEDSESRV